MPDDRADPLAAHRLHDVAPHAHVEEMDRQVVLAAQGNRRLVHESQIPLESLGERELRRLVDQVPGRDGDSLGDVCDADDDNDGQ